MNSSQTLMAANWKMHKTPSEAKAWMTQFCQKLSAQPSYSQHSQVLFCVPFTHLPALREVVSDAVALGAQDVSAHAQGAYTGEVSAAMLADLGVRYVIVGHSERRNYHQENDRQIAQKLHQVQQAQMTPILCVGESLDQREAGEAEQVTLGQVQAALAEGDPAHLVIAYEPLWAIGTGKTATAADAQAMSAAIRSMLRARYGEQVAGAVPILYGGSMKPANAAELLRQPDVDGGLIGGASLEVASMLELLAKAAEVAA